MYRLIFAGELITGFQREETVDNLAKLLKLSPDDVRKQLFSSSPVELNRVDDELEARRWRLDFAEAGAVLIVLPGDEATPEGSRHAGADPANVAVSEPTIASVTARLPAVRRRNRALMLLGALALIIVIVVVIGAHLFG